MCFLYLRLQPPHNPLLDPHSTPGPKNGGIAIGRDDCSSREGGASQVIFLFYFAHFSQSLAIASKKLIRLRVLSAF